MDFIVKVGWYERGVIPPRCRKPRDVFHTSEVTVTVPEFTAEQAPVAIRRSGEDTERDNNREPSEYRWLNGKLFTPYWYAVGTGRVTSADMKEMQYRLEESARYHWANNSEAEAVKAVQSWADNHPLIDGVMQEVASEPMFEVVVYSWRGHSVWVTVTDQYRQGPTDHYFSALEWDKANALARSIAAKGFDYDDLSQLAGLDVLIPEAIQANPQSEAKAVELALQEERAKTACDLALLQVDYADKALKAIAAVLEDDPKNYQGSSAIFLARSALTDLHDALVGES